MHTDEELGKKGVEGTADSDDENQEKGLQWLLDMDLTEPEEKLFTVTGNEYQDGGLTAFEAEVAGRPLTRGNASSDDLTSYVAEEIVISSDSVYGDIYSADAQPDDEASPAGDDNEVMAVDYSLGRESSDAVVSSSVDEGSDILGLASDDDMGERYLALKRVKASKVEDSNAGGDQVPDEESSALEENCAVKTSELPVTNLTEAPVPSQVADPANLAAVANEASQVWDENLDEGEIDKLLLDAQDVASDPGEPLEFTLDGEDFSANGSDNAAIDYHEDFAALEDFPGAAMSEITAVIAPVMEEITARVEARTQELALPSGAVSIDIMLGTDEESIRACYAQGFQPVSAICDELPQALAALAVEQRDMLYVRLLNSDSKANWNDLFGADFVAQDHAVPAVEAAIDFDDLDIDMPAGTDASAGDALADDIFGADFGADFDTVFDEQDESCADDIEAAFLDMSVDLDEEAAVDADFADLDADELAAMESGLAFADTEFAGAEQAAEAGQDETEQPVAQEEPALPEEADGGLLAFMGSETAARSGMAWCIPESVTFSYTSQSNAEIFADFLDAFIEEGSAELEKLENVISEWEKEFGNEELFAEAARTLHTIKGIAKGVGLQRLGTLVHNFETLLEALPEPTDSEQPLYFRIINAWLDAVVRGVEFVTDNRVDIGSELPMQASEVAAAEQACSQAAAEPVPVEEEPEEVDEATLKAREAEKQSVLSALEKKRDKQLADDGAKVLAAQQSVRMTSEKLDLLLNLASQAQQLGVRASQNTSRSKRSSSELQGRLTSVRTHIGKIADRALLNVNARGGSSTNEELDALEMDQYSELQEAASILREGVEDLSDLVEVVSRQNAQIESLLNQQSSVISSISSSIQSARVVPVSRLMPGLRRIVRTVSTDLGKDVTFKVLNETGALDRDHYARLQVVLEHMVRNALDHGIEAADERLAAGKPTGGRITIDVRKSGGDYIIKLTDDGKGIDADAIRESAYEKGLDVDVDELSDDEVIRLIFHKGFSTASSLSEISGRGVGMDIVLNELQQIGGDIQIQSTVGEGTSFEVRIPSNVSVNGALLVAAAEESYAIPLNGLIAVEMVPVEDFFSAVEQGCALTLFDMDCEPGYLGTLCQGVGLPERTYWDAFVPVIIAGTEDRHMAIAIDNVEEALELVVRSLGSQFSTVPGVAGAATTTDGEAIIALDLNLLVDSVGPDGIAAVAAASQSGNTTLLALVVDDSRTQRMVATSQLDTVGVETITAENGLVAIDLLNATHRLPDVVLLDVEMPVKDGIETLREIRKSRRYGHLPVIMVTSRTGAKHRALARDAGCNAYMGKPFNFPALIEQINDLTGHELQLS